MAPVPFPGGTAVGDGDGDVASLVGSAVGTGEAKVVGIVVKGGVVTVVPDVGVAGAVVGAVVVVTGMGTVVGDGMVGETETVGCPVAGRAVVGRVVGSVGPVVWVFVAVAAMVVELLTGASVVGFGVCVRVGVRFAVCAGDGVAAVGFEID